MGLTFDISMANWIAYILEPGAPIPPFHDPHGPDGERAALFALFDVLSRGFLSSEENSDQLSRVIEACKTQLSEPRDSGTAVAAVVANLRGFFEWRPWTAMIVPSGNDDAVDSMLCDRELLQDLVRRDPASPGLILQLESAPQQLIALDDVFPAFEAALEESSRWPGLLVWHSGRDRTSAFFPCGAGADGEAARNAVRLRLVWIIERLYRAARQPVDPLALADLRQFFEVAFPDTRRTGTRLHLVQLSDMHLGSSEAGARLPRLRKHFKTICELCDSRDTIVPILSGDLMDSPSEANLDAARKFLGELRDLGYAPLCILGNHDVRKDGWLRRMLGEALQLPTTHGVHWYDDARVGIVCMNSVVGGHLATGYIGERQRIDIASEIECKRAANDFALVGVLHHHPVAVEPPSWVVAPWYERWLGNSFEKTELLEDATEFVSFVEATQMTAVLHGHKHIPRIAKTPNKLIPVFGCGSSVGKIKTNSPGRTCISINLLTLDPAAKFLTGRLLVEETIGQGLFTLGRHSLVYRARSDWRHSVLSSR